MQNVAGYHHVPVKVLREELMNDEKIEVDFGLCESNGVCMGIIPEVFELDDDDYLHVLTEEVTPENEAKVGSRAAVPAAGHRDHRIEVSSVGDSP